MKQLETSNSAVYTVLTLPATDALNILIAHAAAAVEEYRVACDDPEGYMDLDSSDLELCTESTGVTRTLF
ncbi:MAG: hypothetical protein ACJA1B_000006 [Polaribacter sp.]